jgi:hypothetical protein
MVIIYPFEWKRILSGWIMTSVVTGTLSSFTWEFMMDEAYFSGSLTYMSYLTLFLGVIFTATNLALFLGVVFVVAYIARRLTIITYGLMALAFHLVVIASNHNGFLDILFAYDIDTVPKYVFRFPATPPFWNELLLIHITLVFLWLLAIISLYFLCLRTRGN